MGTASKIIYLPINNGTVVMIDDGPPPQTFLGTLKRRITAHIQRNMNIYIIAIATLTVLLIFGLSALKSMATNKYLQSRRNMLENDSKYQTTSFPSTTNAFSVNSGTYKKPNGNHEDEMLSTLKEDDYDAISTTLIPETMDELENSTLHLNDSNESLQDPFVLHIHDQNDSNESLPAPLALFIHDQNEPKKSLPVSLTLLIHDQNNPNESLPVTLPLCMLGKNDPKESLPVSLALLIHDQNDPNESLPVPLTLCMHGQDDPKESLPVPIALRNLDQNDSKESLPVPLALRKHDQNDPKESLPVPLALRKHDQNDPKKSLPVPLTPHIHDILPLLKIRDFWDEKETTSKHEYKESGDDQYSIKDSDHSSIITGIGEANLTSIVEKISNSG